MTAWHYNINPVTTKKISSEIKQQNPVANVTLACTEQWTVILYTDKLIYTRQRIHS